MKILILAFTSKEYKSEQLYTSPPTVYTDRADLTRKLSCMETWVPRVEALGHEVIFFDGNHPEVSFDIKNKILHLTTSDSYDYFHLHQTNQPSKMFVRLKEAIRWALENREFDYILRIDDGSYVNAYLLDQVINELQNTDIMWSGYGGGGGIFFSKKACEEFITLEGSNEYHLEDITIFNSALFTKSKYTKRTSNKLCSTYVLGENLFTIHYTTGKRMYLADFIISSYHNDTPLPRKVILNYPINSSEGLKSNTMECGDQNTPLWYGLDRDLNNWEYYGNYTRSSYYTLPVGVPYYPFGKNSIKYLFIYNFYNLDFSDHTENYIKYYIDTLQSNGLLQLFHTDEFTNQSSQIENILDENNISYIKESNIEIQTLTNAKYINKSEQGTLITIKK